MKRSWIIGCLLLIINHASAQYYGQMGQDKYLNEHFFHNKRNGVFIDIGAFDGITMSNTYFFEKELGWTGICFEPHALIYPQLKANRSCECIQACVAGQDELVDFIQASGYPIMLSGMAATYDPRHLNRLVWESKKHNAPFNYVKVQARSLMAVLKERGIKEVDYLSVDTQGSELEILKKIYLLLSR